VTNGRERAKLKTHVVEMPRFPGHFGWIRPSPTENGGAPGAYRVAYFRFAVANDSSLPNAILGYTFWVKAKDDTWMVAPVYPRFDNIESSELPINVPPLQTIALDVWLRIWVDVPEEKTGFFSAIASPAEVKVEPRPLGDKTFTDTFGG